MRWNAHPKGMAHRMTTTERAAWRYGMVGPETVPNRFGNTPHTCDNPDCAAWCDADHIPLQVRPQYGGRRLA